jgi:hypothetical protein
MLRKREFSMKISAALVRTLREKACRAVSTVRGQILALAALSLPVLLSSFLAGPSAAQAMAGGTLQAQRPTGTPQGFFWNRGPRVTPTPTPPAPSLGWKRRSVSQSYVGITPYRLTVEVELIVYKVSSTVYRSTCVVRFVDLERRVLGNWNSVGPSSLHASGSFSGPRSPVNSSGGSGYLYPNPFSNQAMSLSTQRLIHFEDTSGPGFAMTHGNYSVTAGTPAGLGSISCQVNW